jgi:hypothetical protein
MKTKYLQIVSLTATIVAGTALMTGCATKSGYKQADKTGAGITEFREEIVNGKKDIDNTMTALSQVAATANQNPRAAFEKYSKSVTDLESTAEKVKKRAADMQARGQAYFTQWEKEMQEVQNPEIKNLAMQRKAKLQETFDSIKKYTGPLKEQFGPWMSDLKDLRTYLSNDLTVTGVDAAKSLFAKTQTEGLEVQKSMNSLVAELNTIYAALTPASEKAK